MTTRANTGDNSVCVNDPDNHEATNVRINGSQRGQDLMAQLPRAEQLEAIDAEIARDERLRRERQQEFLLYWRRIN